MPDPTPLTATPSSAKALAAAGAGETVVLRVPFSDADAGTAYVKDGRLVAEFLAPVAEGERVACLPRCEACWQPASCDGQVPGALLSGVDPAERVQMYLCDTCCTHDQQEGPCSPVEPLFATALATPTPERCFCEDCDGIGRLPDEGATECGCGGKLTCIACGGVGFLPVHRCPTCNGKPDQWRWRVEVRREKA